MAPRTSWKGFLKLSLISVPVKAFTANNTEEEVHLNQLHKDCHQRVRYKKVCPEHGELKQTEIVSGYEYAKDQYVVIDPQELMRLRPESDKSVRIDGFVGADAIDERFLAGRTYYLLPDGVAGAKPYALLAKGMADKGVVAVAQIVISGKEQLVMLHPVDDLLVLSVLHVAKRVKAPAEFRSELSSQEMSKEELKLTNTLIEASTIEEFDFESYDDAYVQKLTELIQLKVDGKEIVAAPSPEEPKILNLMDALKKSVAEAQAGAAHKMAASTKEAGRKKAPARKQKSG
jgi:DNA end-binding protein Ku